MALLLRQCRAPRSRATRPQPLVRAPRRPALPSGPSALARAIRTSPISSSWRTHTTIPCFMRPILHRRWFTAWADSEGSADAPRDEDRPTAQIRAGLRQLYLRVHPDFFAQVPRVQAHNDKSLKQLNALLDSVDEASQSVGDQRDHIILDKNKVPNRVHLTFYVKQIKVESKIFAAQTKIEVEFESVATTCVFPTSFFSTPFPRSLLHREVSQFLNDLLRQAQLPLLPLPDDDKTERSQEDDLKFDESRRRKPEEVHRDLKYAQVLNRDMSDSEIYYGKFEATGGLTDVDGRDYARGREFALKMRRSWQQQDMYCEGTLTGEQRGKARGRIAELWARKLLPAEIPIIVTETGKYLPASEVPGFLTIPWDYDPAELKAYLQQNLADARSLRNRARQEIVLSEHYRRHLCDEWGVDSIEIQAEMDLALEALRKLSLDSKKLAQYKPLLDGITVELLEHATEASIDLDSDALRVPFAFTVAQLAEFIKKETTILRLRAMLNPFSVSFITATRKKLRFLEKKIQCRRLLFDASLAKQRPLQEAGMDHLYKHSEGIVAAAEECGLELGRVNLHLGDSFAFSLRQQKLVLPYNFSAIEDVTKLFATYAKRVRAEDTVNYEQKQSREEQIEAEYEAELQQVAMNQEAAQLEIMGAEGLLESIGRPLSRKKTKTGPSAKAKGKSAAAATDKAPPIEALSELSQIRASMQRKSPLMKKIELL